MQCVLLARDGIVVVCRLSVDTHERHLPSVGVSRDDHLGLLGEIYGRLRSVQCLHDDFAHAAHVGRHTNGAMVEPLESWIEFQVSGALRLEGVAQDFDGKVEQGVACTIIGMVKLQIARKEGNDASQILFRKRRGRFAVFHLEGPFVPCSRQANERIRTRHLGRGGWIGVFVTRDGEPCGHARKERTKEGKKFHFSGSEGALEQQRRRNLGLQLPVVDELELDLQVFVLQGQVFRQVEAQRRTQFAQCAIVGLLHGEVAFV